jgi:CheY-like chemotaxis protein
MSASVGVLVADDSPVFLEAAVAVVDATPGFEVVATCRSGSRAVELAGSLQPQLALLDQNMPGVDQSEALRAIAEVSPETFVIVVSADPQPDGAAPFVDKRRLSPETLSDLWQHRPTEEAGQRAARATRASRDSRDRTPTPPAAAGYPRA